MFDKITTILQLILHLLLAFNLVCVFIVLPFEHVTLQCDKHHYMVIYAKRFPSQGETRMKLSVIYGLSIRTTILGGSPMSQRVPKRGLFPSKLWGLQ